MEIFTDLTARGKIKKSRCNVVIGLKQLGYSSKFDVRSNDIFIFCKRKAYRLPMPTPKHERFPENLIDQFFNEYGWAPSRRGIICALRYFAMSSKDFQRREFNEVAEDLNCLPNWDGKDRPLSNSLEFQNEKSKAKLSKFIQYWGRAAVGRAIDPGIKAQNALILTGEQGIGKTQFFKDFAGISRFTGTNFFHCEEKFPVKVLERVKGKWIVQYENIDNVFKGKNGGTCLRHALDTDLMFFSMRGRYPNRMHVGFINCGTTQDPDFLIDEYNQRRFIFADIKSAQLEERKQVLAQLIYEYRNKMKYWADESEFSEYFRPNLTHRRYKLSPNKW